MLEKKKGRPSRNNTLNKVNKGIGKTVHCLRVACASSLLNAGEEEKLVLERTGHRSYALLKYEKPIAENKGKVCYLLGPNTVLSCVKYFQKGNL